MAAQTLHFISWWTIKEDSDGQITHWLLLWLLCPNTWQATPQGRKRQSHLIARAAAHQGRKQCEHEVMVNTTDSRCAHQSGQQWLTPQTMCVTLPLQWTPPYTHTASPFIRAVTFTTFFGKNTTVVITDSSFLMQRAGFISAWQTFSMRHSHTHVDIHIIYSYNFICTMCINMVRYVYCKYTMLYGDAESHREELGLFPSLLCYSLDLTLSETFI